MTNKNYGVSGQSFQLFFLFKSDESALVLLKHLTDFVQQYTFKSSYWCARAVEDQEGGHGRNLEHVLDLLAFITIDIDENVFFIKLFGKGRHFLLDRLARTAPSGGDLAECFLCSSTHDSLTEFINVLRVNKRHDDDLFRILFNNYIEFKITRNN